MKKNLIIILLSLLFSNKSFAESFFLKNCKISNLVIGNYIIDIEKNLINVELKAKDGQIQNFSDEIKSIETNKIISQKIKSGKAKDIYYQYFLNSKSKSIIKLEYKKISGAYGDVFKLIEKRLSYCLDVKGGWNKAKIEKAKTNKEQKEILKAQEKIKKEQETIPKCQDNDVKKWTNCKGVYKSETGHKYSGLFKLGEIIKGISIYPGGAKYVGEFKNYIPHGYGTFVWANGDKYYGEWKNGQSDGNGTKIWNNGRKYLGKFKEDKLHGRGTLFYPDGKKYEGEFLNGKRHGKGTFTYSDGSAYIGNFISGKEHGVGDCISPDGSSVKCKGKVDLQTKDISNINAKSISIVAKKWVRISQYDTNTKKGKKIMDKLKNDFEVKAKELCLPKTYNVLEKKIEVLEVDETPAYGLETKLKIGINGSIECK